MYGLLASGIFFFPEVNQLLSFICWMLRRVLFKVQAFFFWDSSCIPSVKCISADFINRMMMADACGWTLLSGDTVWLVSCTQKRHRREKAIALCGCCWEQTGHLTHSEALSSSTGSEETARLWSALPKAPEGLFQETNITVGDAKCYWGTCNILHIWTDCVTAYINISFDKHS